MQLLVSVRSAEEATAALAGGADVIDAKDPAQGALGAVSRAALRAIDRVVPADVPLSVALGEAASAREAEARVAALTLRARPAPLYVKLACAGCADGDQRYLTHILAAAVRVARELPASPRLIAAAYVDASDGSRATDALVDAAAAAGTAGVLLDTARKDGRSLLDWRNLRELRRWVARAHAAGLLAALAGSLRAEHVPVLAAVHADVFGVRGAACDGGRRGTLSGPRVRALRSLLDAVEPPPGPRAHIG
ncbi:MAG TPA: (5-formylfuran-3-yl)methyl phosphate synthase [Gemmatimonadales bacterium]|nr:(5-formylfuran-3-yl)methyl phosphate synthase [Gemmatimonadales bacterium]